MSSVVYLYLAYAFAVTLIGGYVLHLVRGLRSAGAEIERLKQP